MSETAWRGRDVHQFPPRSMSFRVTSLRVGRCSSEKNLAVCHTNGYAPQEYSSSTLAVLRTLGAFPGCGNLLDGEEITSQKALVMT